MQHFLVERYLPDGEPSALDSLARSIEVAIARLRSEGLPIRYVSSTLVPGERCCFCVFEAESAEVVLRANREAGADLDRISPAEYARSGALTASS